MYHQRMSLIGCKIIMSLRIHVLRDETHSKSVTVLNILRGKSILYKLWQPVMVPGDWGSHVYRQSAHEGAKVVSPTHRPPLLVLISVKRLSRPHGHSAAGRIMLMKNFNDTIVNRTRDLPGCSAVPQPTAPTAYPKIKSTWRHFKPRARQLSRDVPADKAAVLGTTTKETSCITYHRQWISDTGLVSSVIFEVLSGYCCLP
jgi:hypothetical protein